MSKHKPSAEGKVLNPVTGRYVKADGKIGKSLKKQSVEKKSDSSKPIGAKLSMEDILEVLGKGTFMSQSKDTQMTWKLANDTYETVITVNLRKNNQNQRPLKELSVHEIKAVKTDLRPGAKLYDSPQHEYDDEWEYNMIHFYYEEHYDYKRVRLVKNPQNIDSSILYEILIQAYKRFKTLHSTKRLNDNSFMITLEELHTKVKDLKKFAHYKEEFNRISKQENNHQGLDFVNLPENIRHNILSRIPTIPRLAIKQVAHQFNTDVNSLTDNSDIALLRKKYKAFIIGLSKELHEQYYNKAPHQIDSYKEYEKAVKITLDVQQSYFGPPLYNANTTSITRTYSKDANGDVVLADNAEKIFNDIDRFLVNAINKGKKRCNIKPEHIKGYKQILFNSRENDKNKLLTFTRRP